MREDYIYDPRVLAALIDSTDFFCLRNDDHNHALIALRTVAADAAALETTLISGTDIDPAHTLPVRRPKDLSLEFQEKLKKMIPLTHLE